jgi:competence protein ComEA
VLTDGQKIHVPRLGDPADVTGTAGSEPGSDGTGSGGQGAGTAKVDLNTASVEELGALPRLGPVLAQRIFDWRKEHGRFSAVEELDAVDGVGPKMLETLLPLVRVS